MRNLASYITLLFLVLTFSVSAQRSLQQGDIYFNQNQFEKAIPYYQKFYDEATGNDRILAMQKLADAYRLNNQFQEAETWYERLLKRQRKEPIHIFNYGLALKSGAKYAEAKEQFEAYQEKVPDDPRGDVFARSCDSAQKWLDNPNTVLVKETKFVNTPEREFGPVLHKDGIVFASSRPGTTSKLIRTDGGNRVNYLDFFYVPITGSVDDVSEPEPFDDNINSPYHEAGITFHPDGKYALLTRTVEVKGREAREIRRKRREKGEDDDVIVSTLRIFMTEYSEEEQEWSEPQDVFPFNSNNYSTGHPAFSLDGNTVFFMCDKEDEGEGGADIYQVSFEEGNFGSEMINLGSELNTFGFELFPSVGPDGKLYFASDGHPGMGKLDIFSATFDSTQGKWTEITNLRPPINSIYDDFSVTLYDGIFKGFFSSNRYDGTGEDDIYSFIDEEKPFTLSVEETIIRIDDLSLFNGIEYRIKDEEEDETVFGGKIDNQYVFDLEQGKPYKLASRKDGFRYDQTGLKFIEDTDEVEHLLHLQVSTGTRTLEVDGILKTSTTDTFIIVNEAGAEYDSVAETQTPVEGILVQLYYDDQLIQEVETDSNGYYKVSLDSFMADFTIIAGSDTSLKRSLPKPKKEKEKPKKEKIQKLVSVQSGGNYLLATNIYAYNEAGEEVATAETDLLGSATLKFADEGSYTVIADKFGYFKDTQQANIKKGDTSILYFDLKEKEKVKIAGNIKDDSGRPVDDASVELYSRKGDMVADTRSDTAGDYEVEAPEEEEYDLVSTKEDFYQKEEKVEVGRKEDQDTYEKDVEMKDIKIGEPVEIENIYFDFASAEVRQDAVPALRKLRRFLEENPSIAIELNSHTDNRGNPRFNLILSRNRSESVVNWLVENGISKERLFPKGYGQSQPKIPNAQSEEDHQKNRRTEFVVVEKSEAVESLAAKYEKNFLKLEAPQDEVEFRVQIAASKTELSNYYFSNIEGVDEILVEKGEDGYIRYFAASYKDLSKARALKDKVVKAGVKDAFISPYYNGERISIQAAQSKLK